MRGTHNNPADLYKANAVLNAPRLKLVQILYDEALTNLRKASARLEEGDRLHFREPLNKAQAIIGELFAVLNFEKGLNIAEDLASLYQFSMSSLIDASAHGSKASVDNVVRILSTLEQGWDNIEDRGD